MREFFRGWRRRLGVVTLVMACVLAAGWLRSLHSREFLFMEFEFPIGGRINVYTSANQMDILLQRSSGWEFNFGGGGRWASNPNAPGDMLGFVRLCLLRIMMAKRQRKKPRYQLEAELQKRIPANPAAQAPNSSWSPPLYYEDIRFKCVDCGAEEVWTAQQQQWWHEVAKGTVYSTAIRCRECREKIRDSHQGTPRRSHAERHQNPPPQS